MVSLATPLLAPTATSCTAIFDDRSLSAILSFNRAKIVGFGSIAMMCNFVVSIVISKLTSPPPQKINDLVDNIRIPES